MPVAVGDLARALVPPSGRARIGSAYSEVWRRTGLRRSLARRFLRGDGVEIGALHLPMALPRGARVRYVDRMTVSELRAHYPELAHQRIVTPDVIADGEQLEPIPDASLDFLIANHVIEHCEDPIGTLKHHQRVLRRGGVLFMAVPDKRRTFDRERPVTELAHLRRDHLEGPQWSRQEHYEQWVRHVEHVPEADIASEAARLDAEDYSIHYHVFTPHNFLEMVVTARSELDLELVVETCAAHRNEFVAVLRRPD